MSRALYRNSFIVLIGTLAAGFGGYLYQLIMGRLLSLADFGALSALANFFAIAGIPAAALTLAATHAVATIRQEGGDGAVRFFLHRMTRWALIGAVGIFAILSLLSVWISRFLSIGSYVPSIIFSLSVMAICMLSLMRGTLTGLQRFVSLSWSSIVESAVKIVGAYLLVRFWERDIVGAVTAVALAASIAYAYALYQLRDLRGSAPQSISFAAHIRATPGILLWNIALAALTSVDVIAVRRFFSATDSGLYAGGSLVAKIIFFCATAVSSALFPMVAERYAAGDHKGHEMLFKRAITLTALVGVVGTAFYMAAPRLIMRVLFGTKFLPFASSLPLLALAAALLSLVQLMASYLLSIRKRWFMVALVLAPMVEIGVIWLWHPTMQSVVVALNVVLGVLAAVLGFGIWRDKHVRKPVV